MEYIFICQLMNLVVCCLCASRPAFDLSNNHRRIAMVSIIPAIVATAYLWRQSILPVVTYKHLYNFLEFGNYSCSIGLLTDSISITVSCVVCFITMLLNFYSIGYVKKKVSAFLLHINLLSFITVMFIASNNLLQMCIFLLLLSVVTYFISTLDNDADTSSKARQAVTLQYICDMGFVIVIAAVLCIFNTLTFEDINKHMAKSDAELMQLEIVAFVLLASILAKIVQVGSIFWKESQENLPIPAMAMINAVGLIPAGIFLLIRLPVLFECSESVQNTVIVAGTLVAIYYGAKSIFSSKVDDLCQNSVCSQVGLMLIMCGFSSYGSAIMLFVINAFSKTLMILAFGSLVFALSGEKDINNMGGLIDLLPKTFSSFMIVIASVIPHYYFYSVFLSEISNSELPTYHLASTSIIVTSFMTSVYLFRNIRLIFMDKSTINETILAYVSENNSLIIRPLYCLMFLSLFAGIIFYITCFQEVFWKDVFAFSASSSSAVVILLLYSVSIVGIICSNFWSKPQTKDSEIANNSPSTTQIVVPGMKDLLIYSKNKCNDWIRKLASVILRVLHQEK
jgi:NADH:ubiquinone oxidoreductase subunit 5 (subunit L)/multisubunit Na+/H+ antiporter MnhA subunit